MSDKKYQNCPICGTPCEVIHEDSERSTPVEETWESFWKPIVSNEDGTINIEQVKKELADFSFVMEQVPKVYCHITGDRMSKVMYRAEDVIRVADDYFNEQLKEALKDELEDLRVNESDQVRASQPPAVKGAEDKYELAFTPCTADDPRMTGMYQSADGESEFCVRELHVPVKESPTAAGDGKEDAVAFGDWAIENNWVIGYNNLWWLDDETYKGTGLTTAQLYDIFKNRNK